MVYVPQGAPEEEEEEAGHLSAGSPRLELPTGGSFTYRRWCW